MIKQNLSKKQKENFGLLQVGTLLEYFDIMIFVHFSFLLNELFFPKTDARTAMLLSAFAFCSTYLLRPVGALFFGFIGDHLGRKPTVILASFMMGLSCIFMANMPTYEEIGVMASYGVTFCRVLQSLSAQGEIIGVEIYLTETIKPPHKYTLVSLTSFFASLGGLLALFLSIAMFKFQMNWRLAYWVGAGISSIGFIARTQLHETPEFISKNRKQKPKEVYNKKSKNFMIAYFFISCGYPFCFYLSYVYLGTILKNSFNYTVEMVMANNFYLAIAQSVSFLVCSLLCYKTHPLKIILVRWWIFATLSVFIYLFFDLKQNPLSIFYCQIFVVAFGINDVPGAGVFIDQFSTYKRFTYTSTLYAFSRIIMYLVSSFGIIFITDFIGEIGIWLMLFLFSIAFYLALKYFRQHAKTYNGVL